jgi:hypothetical protein
LKGGIEGKKINLVKGQNKFKGMEIKIDIKNNIVMEE